MSNDDVVIGSTLSVGSLPVGYVNSSPLINTNLGTTSTTPMGGFDFGILLNPVLVPGTIVAPADLCGTSGTPGTISATSNATGGSITSTRYKYQWQSSTTPGGGFTNTSAADSLTTLSPAAISSTTYYKRGVSTKDASNVDINSVVYSNVITVTLNPLPTISGTLTVCVNATTQLTGSATAAANPWVSSNTAIATVTSLGLVTGVSAGTVTITYTNTNGCSQTAIVTVNPLPAISGTLSVCNGLTTTLTGSGTPAGTPWQSSNTSVATISNLGLVTSVSAGTVTITYTNNNGCAQTASFTVNSLPTATINAGGPTSFCTGGSVNLTASAGNSWLWSTGAITQTINVTTSGSYSVTVTNASSCSATSAITTVTVNAIPSAPTAGNGGAV